MSVNLVIVQGRVADCVKMQWMKGIWSGETTKTTKTITTVKSLKFFSEARSQSFIGFNGSKEYFLDLKVCTTTELVNSDFTTPFL